MLYILGWFVNRNNTLMSRELFFKKTILIFFLLLFLILPLNIQIISAQNYKSSLQTDLSMTLGFILGQEYSLNLIKSHYPDLKTEIKIAESKFEVSFGEAETSIRSLLKDMLQEDYSKFLESLQEQMKEYVVFPKDTPKVAIDFLAQVESRAQGNIPSPVLETLLTYQYMGIPGEEFSQGYNQIFRTSESSKVVDIDLQIRYPMSWLPEEGERPHVIQKFTSEMGRGSEGLVLTVVEIPEDYSNTLSEQYLENFFTESNLKDMTPEESTFISGKPVVLDKNKGGMIIYEALVEQLDFTIKTRSLAYITIYDNKMIWLMFSVSALPDGENKLKERYNRFETLFKLMVNSFVIQEQYKKGF